MLNSLDINNYDMKIPNIIINDFKISEYKITNELHNCTKDNK